MQVVMFVCTLLYIILVIMYCITMYALGVIKCTLLNFRILILREF
jgi:hypothetical protein